MMSCFTIESKGKTYHKDNMNYRMNVFPQQQDLEVHNQILHLHSRARSTKPVFAFTSIHKGVSTVNNDNNPLYTATN